MGVHATGQVALQNKLNHTPRPLHTIITDGLAREAERQNLVLSELDDDHRMSFAALAAIMIADHAREENTRRVKRDPDMKKSILPILDPGLIKKSLERHYDNLLNSPIPYGRRAVYELQQSYVALATQQATEYPEIFVALAVGAEFSEAGYSEASDVIESDLLAVYGATLYMQGKRLPSVTGS